MLAVLGLNDNRATVIRRMWNDIALHTVHASPGGVVSPDEERRFWLRYYYGTFALGKHGEPAYFKWADPSFEYVIISMSTHHTILIRPTRHTVGLVPTWGGPLVIDKKTYFSALRRPHLLCISFFYVKSL